MKPKKIAIVYSGAKNPGGIENYLENLFKYADFSRVQLELFSLGEWPLTDKIKKTGGMVRVFSGGRINIGTIFKIAKVLKKDGFDLVVSQGTVANAYARAAALFSGLPSLVTVHSEREADYQNSLIRFIYTLSDMISRFKTKNYIAVSEYLKQKTINEGVSGKKIEVIYNGVEAPRKLPGKKANKRILIGSIGRLHPVKNYAELINSVAILSKDDCDLTIWGEGSERKVLEKSVTDLGLTSNISLSGYVSNIWEALSEVDIYVQPSLSEGFGLTVVEAQLSGLPVVVTPGGALTELVKDGQTGVVADGFTAVEIAKAILRLINNPDLARTVAKNAQEAALKRFNINVWAVKTVDAYIKASK